MSLAGFTQIIEYLILKKTKIMLVGTHQRTASAEDLVIDTCISNTRLDRVS